MNAAAQACSASWWTVRRSITPRWQSFFPLSRNASVYAIDRRGHGTSGDSPVRRRVGSQECRCSPTSEWHARPSARTFVGGTFGPAGRAVGTPRSAIGVERTSPIRGTGRPLSSVDVSERLRPLRVTENHGAWRCGCSHARGGNGSGCGTDRAGGKPVVTDTAGVGAHDTPDAPIRGEYRFDHEQLRKVRQPTLLLGERNPGWFQPATAKSGVACQKPGGERVRRRTRGSHCCTSCACGVGARVS